MIRKIIIFIFAAYVILWLFSIRSYDADLGISYSPEYAAYLGVDPDVAFDAILSDLNPQFVRLAVPWNRVEALPGVFDYSDIDRMVKKAADNGTRIVLTLGQKVPRWPECYIPGWAETLSAEEREAALLDYVRETVLRYKDDPAIEFWQAENEPFIRFPFGECALFETASVKKEVSLIRELDPSRKIVMTDSGELSTFRRASFLGDILGTTMYRTTRAGNGFVLRYDWLPPAFYMLKARLWGNSREEFFVSELQAEPWYNEIPTDAEGFAKEETFSPKRFLDNVSYAKRAGASRVYLWGAEWWYFMKEKQGDERYWDTAKGLFGKEKI